MNKIYSIDDIPSEYLCNHCNYLLKSPVTCSDCFEANFCQQCGETVLQSTGKCPSCKANWSDKSLKTNPMLLKLYNIEEIKCSNSDCTWQGKFVEFFEHQIDCEQKPIQCFFSKYGCEWKGVKVELEKHEKICVFRPFIKFFEKFERENQLLREENKNLKESLEKTENNLKKEINEQINKLKDIIDQNLETKIMLSKYSGVLKNISLKTLLDEGFKIGLQKTYDYKNTFDEFQQFKDKPIVVLAARETGKDMLLLAAMGKGWKVLKETYEKTECHLENGAYWYYCRKENSKSIGFSSINSVSLGNPDTVEGDLKLSWYINGSTGGYRIGNQKSLYDSNYEKIVLFHD